MSILTDKLPQVIQIDNAEVPINWDFRISIRFGEILQKRNIDDNEILVAGLQLYYPTIETQQIDISAAVEKMLWFYRCGKDDIDYESESSNKKDIRCLSYEHDDGNIYAAFMQQYGIDLCDIEDLHWWKFKTLFDGLAEDVPIVKIMGYRATDINKIPKEERAYYKKMKKRYALPDRIDPEEKKRLKEMNEVLANGGNVSALLE
jgi:hypothetical protein